MPGNKLPIFGVLAPFRHFKTMTSRPLSAVAVFIAATAFAGNWPNWRGPNQDGSSDEKNLPEKFSKTAGVKWAADVPGMAASCPVVWGDSVFLTAPIASEGKLAALCYDAKTGKEKWRKLVAEGSKWDANSNLANPSPTTDGERVGFLFSNAQLACFDFAGKELWTRDLTQTHGAFGTQWTYASSPLLDGGRLYIQVLQRDGVFVFQGVQKGTPGKDMSSYLLALDPLTGKDLWKVIRPSTAAVETLESFSTPVAHTHEGAKQLLITGGDCITGHDPSTGKELWRWGNWNPDKNNFLRLVPSAVAGDGIAVVCAPKKRPAFGVPLGRSGQLSDGDLAWTSQPDEATSDVSTPAFYQGHFYLVDSDRKAIACIVPKTGKVLWRGELPSKAKIESSPVIADGKLYVVNFWGEVFVVKASPEKFELLHTAAMGDGSQQTKGTEASVRATIALANGSLYIRAQDKLYCVGK